MKLNIQSFAIFAYLASMAIGALFVDLVNVPPVTSFVIGGGIASFWIGIIPVLTSKDKYE